MYNTATQERTAPGSTYKPLVSIAGLTEGLIDTGTYFNCTGEYDKVEPPPRCWVYPNAHGSLAIEGAIQNSCNCFFYEVGYQMSIERSGPDEDGDGKADNVTFPVITVQTHWQNMQKLSDWERPQGLRSRNQIPRFPMKHRFCQRSVRAITTIRPVSLPDISLPLPMKERYTI